MSRPPRGRGRGTTGGSLSHAKSLLKRTALEAGLDPGGSSNLSAIHDITRPPLYPNFTWHSSGHIWTDESERTEELVTTKRSSSTVYMMNKQRELVARLQRSAHYVRPSQQIDVIRYGSQNRQVPVDVAVLESMGCNNNNKLAKDDRYIPSELLLEKPKPSISSPTIANRPRQRNLDELEQREQTRRPEQQQQRQQQQQSQPEQDERLVDNLDEEDDDEVEDYTTNYYASEEESDGGDGGEATF